MTSSTMTPRSRRTEDIRTAPLLAASILLDILNPFLLFLSVLAATTSAPATVTTSLSSLGRPGSRVQRGGFASEQAAGPGHTSHSNREPATPFAYLVVCPEHEPLSDGTAAYEQVTDYHPPSWFAYEVSGFTNILGRFVHGARGSWTFSPTEQGGTLIEWTYGFRPKRFRSLATRLLIAPIWRPYMR